MTWTLTPNNARTMTCSSCATTFAVGRHCACPFNGGATGAPHDAPTTLARAGSSVAPPSTSEYESRLVKAIDGYARRMDAMALAAAHLRARVGKIPVPQDEIEAIGCEFQLRQASLQERLIGQQRAALTAAADIKRKGLEGLMAAATKREIPALVERAERAALILRTRAGRLAVRDPKADGGGN